jgi:receptor protein-tyrosine kinase
VIAVVRALLRFRHSIGMFTVLGILLGTAYGLMKPNSYTSTGTLLLRRGARESETAEAAIAGRTVQDVRQFDVIANEIQILSHRDTFRRVIESVGVARILEAYDPRAEDNDQTMALTRALHELQAWWFSVNTDELREAPPARREYLALKTLMDNMALEATSSSLIQVQYEAHTRELAKTITDAFLAAAEEHHRQVYSNRTSLDFLKTRDAEARAATDTATNALAAFDKEHGIFDIDSQRAAALDEIGKLEIRVASDQEELQSHASRCGSLEELLEHEPAMQSVTTETAATVNPAYTGLQAQSFLQQGEMVRIKGTEPDQRAVQRHVQELEKQNAATEARLKDVPPTIPGPPSQQMVKNTRHERLQTQLDESKLAIVGLRVAHDLRVARLDELRTRLQALEQEGPRHAALVSELKAREADTKRIQDNLKSLEVLSLLDEQKISNLKVLEPGDVPILKTGPNRMRLVVMGAALAFLLGFGVALLRDRMDGSLRREQDLHAIDAAVLGVIPELRGAEAALLDKGAGLADSKDPSLRRRLDAIWGRLVPPWIPRDRTASIALVGDGTSPGVTTIGLYLALRSARCLNLNVLLVEANWHNPSLADRQGRDAVRGFAELLAGTASRDEVVRPTGVPGLRIVYAGSGDAAKERPRDGRRPQEVLRSLSDGFQLVIVDVPSIVDHPEFRAVVWCADEVVPVFAAGRSTRAGAEDLLDAIRAAGKEIAGAILNRWRSLRPFWLPESIRI